MKWAAARRHLTDLSIAWAVVEALHAGARPRTLFATHYHELTELEQLLPGVKNVHVSVQEAGKRNCFSAARRAGERRQELRHRSGAAGGPAERRDRARARNSAAGTKRAKRN